MPSIRHEANRPPADASASSCVRTLDVYPIKVSPPSSHDADRDYNASLPSQMQRALQDKATRGPAGANAHATPLSEIQVASSTQVLRRDRIVTEDEYRLSPQEVQRRVQENLAAQVRSLLEARLQQRLQQARVMEAGREAQQRQAAAEREAAATCRAAGAASTGASSADAPKETTGEGSDVNVAAVQPHPLAHDAEAEKLSYSTARLLPREMSSAATDTAPVVDPKKYAETLNAYPYSAVELVRVHRLKGIPDHNRGLFAALAKRSFTTRSGYLVVNPDLEGKGRVRSAVSGHVWGEQRRHFLLQRQQQQQQQQQQQSSTQLDATGSKIVSSSAAPLLPNAYEMRQAPLRLVMKVVGEGSNATFVWTEDNSSYDSASEKAKWTNISNISDSAMAPFSAALAEVLELKYGRPLTTKEKIEAERRLRERRRRGKEPQDKDDQSNAGKRRTGKEKDDFLVAGDRSKSSSSKKTVDRVSSAVAGGRGVASGASLSPTEGLLLIHDPLPTAYDEDAAHNLRFTSAAAKAGVFGSTDSFHRRPRSSLSASGVDALPPSNRWGTNHSPISRAGLSVSDLERTMSVGESRERQLDREARARLSKVQGDLSPLSKRTLGRKKNSQDGSSRGESSGGLRATRGKRRDGSGKGGVADSSSGGGVGSWKTASSPLSRRFHDSTSASDLESDLDALSKRSGSNRARRATIEGGISSVTATGAHHGSDEGGAKLTASAANEPPTLEEHPLSPLTAATTGEAATGTLQGTDTSEPSAVLGQKQHDVFLEYFPEAEAHVQLRHEAENVLDELGDMWDEDCPMGERPFPLPLFSSQDFHFPGFDDDGNGVAEGQQGSKDGDGASRGSGLSLPDDLLVGFEVDVDVLQKKFKVEATEEYSDLASKRDALLADVLAQRQLIRDFSDDVHFLSVGNPHRDLTAEQYAFELTYDVNAYAKKNHLRFSRLTEEDEAALREQIKLAEDQAEIALDFLERFSSDRVSTRDVGCQVNDEDLCYVDAAVRSTEAQLESLVHHEKALLSAVRLATVAVANILSFHASLEMESTCHECFFVFDKPRTLWPCGHTFCHACLSNMYNSRGDLICSECGSVCEVGYTPNLTMELIANYQTVYTRADADAHLTSKSVVEVEKEAQTIEGVLRNLLNDLLATQNSWNTPST
ncbi:hypothetical protein ABL78_4861 [Leptomonas seymouri]|uniref:RING-type domain-containing protein n=1 Tax=Leptomonas seymouri TaxID=5684 RepID=A0A0N0P553_LEPSE|nr:hypothetical protein ABL78_4861 [Leptomonas seymouri]|eukprot:KPI86059.1 hypothetical protein ABL78_4861 [Leptomonas seymouri]